MGPTTKPHLAVVALFVLTTHSGAVEGDRTLSFEDRVRAQEAIQRVYHGHVVGPARPFEQAVPRAVLERQVRQYLDQANALDVIWKTPVTAVMLRSEIERIVRDTQAPSRLAELFEALGNDAVVIQECLARPILVDRLSRNFYTSGALSSGAGQTVPWDAWWETARRPFAGRDVATVAVDDVPALDAFAPAASPPPCVPDDTWDNGSLDDVPDGRMGHVAVWTGSRMVVWGGMDGNRGTSTGSRYDPATDTWSPTARAGAPSGRSQTTAVWTGNRMLVWGGYDGVNPLGTGAAYDPAADEWTPIADAGAPSPRSGHVAVWTGSRMLVWGGRTDLSMFADGASYDPGTNAWTPISTSGAPEARHLARAVWTGSRMLVWGGRIASGDPTASGGAYDSAFNSWTPMSTVNAPSARVLHTAVWTGARMIVWGGEGLFGVRFQTGARYDPLSDTWSATATSGAPSARTQHSAVWTGSEMIVWDGDDGSAVSAAGARYSPATNTWLPISSVGAPASVTEGAAVWTGDRMIVWGGYDPRTGARPRSGGRYAPASDSWTRTVAHSGPEGREQFAGVWTGNVMIVWGGAANGEGAASNTGGRYDPTTDSWSPTSTIGAPLGRNIHAAVWTGREMIVWGGWNFGLLNSGGRYDPTADTWAPTSLVGAPSGRTLFTAVWTGSRMVVWGGMNDAGGQNTGGRYDPGADTWSPTSVAGAPSARALHTAQWTGSRMVIWGGSDDIYFNTGGLYDPVADTWIPTSPVGAPSRREAAASAWTGSRMVVWGGLDGNGVLGTGGRFDPVLNAWSPMSTTGAPSPRSRHAAVWTGREVVFWGGASDDNGDVTLGDGGRYDPVSNGWTPMALLGAPSARTEPVAVWTGARAVIWGGTTLKSSGGRYALGDALDGDGDGLSRCQGDCDDGNGAIHPGATELCNFVDEDCDGIVDDGFDIDSDGFTSCGGDCNDGIGSVWSTPGEVRQLRFEDRQTLAWTAPAAPGGTALVYDTLRSSIASDFVGAAFCVESADGSDTTATDDAELAPGTALHFLVRAANSCPDGTGTLGSGSAGIERPGRICP